MINIQIQTMIFMGACLLGAFLGIVYDAFRISRIAVKTHNILIFIEDVIFFVIVTVSSFIYIIVNNNGVLRGFLIIGELLGALIYFSTLSIAIIKAANFIIKIIKSILRFIYKIIKMIIKPIIRLVLFVYKILKKVCCKLKKKIKFKRVKIEDSANNVESNVDILNEINF